jgi:signal transduction histidine kinase
VHRNGFGLGLPIVQELIHAHGGRVEVDSQPGIGSTFRVILPTLREGAGQSASETTSSKGVRHEAQPS